RNVGARAGPLYPPPAVAVPPMARLTVAAGRNCEKPRRAILNFPYDGAGWRGVAGCVAAESIAAMVILPCAVSCALANALSETGKPFESTWPLLVAFEGSNPTACSAQSLTVSLSESKS